MSDNIKRDVLTMIEVLSRQESMHHSNALDLESRKADHDPAQVEYQALENAEFFFRGKEEATREATDGLLAIVPTDPGMNVSDLESALYPMDGAHTVLVNTPNAGLVAVTGISTWTDNDGRTHVTLEVDR